MSCPALFLGCHWHSCMKRLGTTGALWGGEGVLPACMSVIPTYMCARGGQKRAFSPLGLQLQVVISYHVGAVNRTQVIRKGSQYS